LTALYLRFINDGEIPTKKALAVDLGVKPPSIQHALVKLAEEGWIKMKPRRHRRIEISADAVKLLRKRAPTVLRIGL
jgi:Mn-dependent DtxR family transcriptional regulator